MSNKIDYPLVKYVESTTEIPISIEVFKTGREDLMLISERMVWLLQTIADDKISNAILESLFEQIGVSVEPEWMELITLSRSRLQQATILLNSSLMLVWEHNFRDGDRILSYMNKPVELASIFIRKLKAGTVSKKHPITRELSEDLEEIVTKMKVCETKVEALKQIENASSIMDKKHGGKMLVWEAIDSLKQAIVCCDDQQVKSYAMSRIGFIFFKILKMPDNAVCYFRGALEILNETPIETMPLPWKKDITRYLTMIEKEKKWYLEKEKIKMMPRIKRAIKLLDYIDTSNFQQFANFLLEFYHPGNKLTINDIMKEQKINNDKETPHVVMFLKHWDWTKLSRNTQDEKDWAVIAEELVLKFKHLDINKASS